MSIDILIERTFVNEASLLRHCVLGPDHGPLRRSLAAELIREGSGVGRHDDLVTGMLWQTVDRFLDADPHAERHLADLRRMAGGAAAVADLEVLLAIRAGRLDEAADRARQLIQMVAVRWYQGRLPELLPLLDEDLGAVWAVAAAITGDRYRAIQALRRFLDADPPRDGSWLATLHAAAEAAYLLSEPAPAARVYELLRPYAELPVVAGFGTVCFGSVHHALGTACLALGDPVQAAEHFDFAVQRNLALGHWPAVALSRGRRAQALARGVARRSSAERATRPLRCSRLTAQSRRWRLVHGDSTVYVQHSVGMLHLAVLIANPNRDVPAVDLVAGVAAIQRRPAEAHIERARVAVGRAIRRAIDRIAAADAVLGEHLRDSVHTGIRCSYRT